MSPFRTESSFRDTDMVPSAPNSKRAPGRALDWNQDRLHRPGWSRLRRTLPSEPASDDASDRSREK